jgi:diacylglycerol kinase family enzyme
MPGTAALIVNPRASSVTEERTRAVERELSRRLAVEIVFTGRRGQGAELAVRAVEAGREAIFVFSGDGGINEVLNGLEVDVPVGVIPGGGANVFARALGVPADPVAATRALGEAFAAGRSRRISLGRVNGRRFGFSAGIGFDAELVRRVDARGRSPDGRRPGNAYFVWAAARLLAERRGRLDPALELRGLGRAAFALVANGDPYTYLGRLPLHAAPRARFELGLDLVAPRRVRPLGIPRLMAYALAGRGQESSPDVLTAHDVDRIEVVCDRPLPLQVDGEDLGDVQEAVFEAEREAVSVLVPV